MQSLKKMATEMLDSHKATVRELARLLGTMVASHPAILPAPLYYRHLERAKVRALQKGLSYSAVVQLDLSSRSDLQWWATCFNQCNGRPLQNSCWDLVVESDASQKEWGASCQGKSTGGPWTNQEKTHHINYLELLAVFLALQCFVSERREISILLLVDVMTIAFLNRMGGTHSTHLCNLAVEVWKWCLDRDIVIPAGHLPDSENIWADWHSRHVADSSDWSLHREIFLELGNKMGCPHSVDLFA